MRASGFAGFAVVVALLVAWPAAAGARDTDPQVRAQTTKAKTFASKRLPRRGGRVSAQRMTIVIPRGVLRRPSRVSISRTAKGVDFHIHARWRGTVYLIMPGLREYPYLAHSVLGRSVLEAGTPHGKRTRFAVTRLSPFDSVKRCFVGGQRAMIRCLIERGIGQLNKSIAKKLFPNCLNPGRDLVSLLLDSCTLDPGTLPPNPDNRPPSLPVGDNVGGSQIPTYNPQQPGPAPQPPPPGPQPPPPGPQPPAPPAARGFTVWDSYFAGTWARTDPNNGTWYSKGNRPANGAYWYDNGLGVGADCARAAAPYTVVWASGLRETWNTWLHVTDGKWFPSAATKEIMTNGLQGLPGC